MSQFADYAIMRIFRRPVSLNVKLMQICFLTRYISDGQRHEVVLQVADGTQTAQSESSHRISDAHRVQGTYSSTGAGTDSVHSPGRSTRLPQDQHSTVDELSLYYDDENSGQARARTSTRPRRGPDGKIEMTSMKAHGFERLTRSPLPEAEIQKQRVDRGLTRAGIKRDDTGVMRDKNSEVVQRDEKGIYRSPDGTVLFEEPKSPTQVRQAEIQKEKTERGLNRAGIHRDEAGVLRDKNGEVVQRDEKGVYRKSDGTVLFEEPKSPVEAGLAKAGVSRGEDGLLRSKDGEVVQRDEKGVYRSPDGKVLFEEPKSTVEVGLAKAGVSKAEDGTLRNKDGEVVQRDEKGVYHNPDGSELFREEKPEVEKSIAKAGVFKDEEGIYRDENGGVVERDGNGVYRKEDGTVFYNEAKSPVENGLAIAGVQRGEDGVLRDGNGEVVQRDENGVYRNEDGTVLYKEEKRAPREKTKRDLGGFEFSVEDVDEEFEFFENEENTPKQTKTKRTKKVRQGLNADGTPQDGFNLFEQDDFIEEDDELEDNGFGISPSDTVFMEQNTKRKKKGKKVREGGQPGEPGFVIDIEELEDEEDLESPSQPTVQIIKRKVKGGGKVGAAYSGEMDEEDVEYLEDSNKRSYNEEGGAHMSADSAESNINMDIFRTNNDDTSFGATDRTSFALRSSIAREQGAAYTEYLAERLKQEDSYIKLEHVGSLQDIPDEYIDEGDQALPQDFFVALMRGYCDKCGKEIKFMDLKELFRYKLLHRNEEESFFDPEV